MTADDRRLAAGTLLGSYAGARVPSWLLDLVADGLGGVTLFADNVIDDEHVRSECARLREARRDVVIAIDEEAGDVTRLDAVDGSPVPGHAVLGAVDEPEVTREAAALLGSRLNDLGVTLNLAPCADVNVDAANPIVGVRAFAGDSSAVARHVAAFVVGLQQSGVSACAKHFPGHGNTTVDSHASLPVLHESLDELMLGALRPFAAAIDAGVRSVMTGHLIAPSVDERPASLSRAWTRVLRSTLGFDGVIVTDALDMGAVAGSHGSTDRLPSTAVEALVAGADLLCLGSKLDREPIVATVDAIVAALGDGRLERAALERTRGRIERLGGGDPRLRPAPHHPDRAGLVDRGRQIAAAALRVEGSVVPRSSGLVVECRPTSNVAVGDTGWGLVGLLGGTGWFGQRLRPGQLPNLDLVHSLATPLVVVVKGAATDPWQREVVERCRAAQPDLVLVEMGWPGDLSPQIAHRVCTFGASRASGEAVLDRLVACARPNTVEQEHLDG